MNLPARLSAYQARVDAALAAALAAPDGLPHPSLQRLQQALAYSVLQGGKRIRPALLYAAAETCSGHHAAASADVPAAALELIHAYSLVHDDLPAMDNDDLRRGQPSCHRAFDEATALLAGDALQTLAFGLLADAPGLEDTTRLGLIRLLSHGAGHAGMAGGQMIDLQAVSRHPALPELELMHRLKTGALIETAVRMGARIAGADTDTEARLACFAGAIGLAFQVHDDILDVTADTATLGKTSGSDAARAKPTYPALLGLDAARALAGQLEQEALAALAPLGAAAEPLRGLAAWIIQRHH